MSNYYPPVGFYFAVTLGDSDLNAADASFQEVSGLSGEREHSDVIKEGGENRFVYRVPGRAKHGNLVLKRGLLATASAFASWCWNTIESDLSQEIETKDIDVFLLDPEGEPLMAWNFKNAWPVKWNVSDLNAQENKIVVEQLEFAYTFFTTSLEEDMGLKGLFEE